VSKAGEAAAQGVSAAAESIDKVTGGVASGPISAVASKVSDTLDPDSELPTGS